MLNLDWAPLVDISRMDKTGRGFGKMRYSVLLLTAFALTACGETSPAENTADMLENAADQSTPAAANVLDNAADAMRENGVVADPSDPGGPVQNALEDAADAEQRSMS